MDEAAVDDLIYGKLDYSTSLIDRVLNITVWDMTPEAYMEKLGFTAEQMLVLDDLKPGYDMAKAANVRFAAAGWSNDIPEIEAFMRQNCDLYFKTVEAFGDYLLHGKEA